MLRWLAITFICNTLFSTQIQYCTITTNFYQALMTSIHCKETGKKPYDHRHQNLRGGHWGHVAPQHFSCVPHPCRLSIVLAVSSSSKFRHSLAKQTKLTFDTIMQSDMLRPPTSHCHFIVSCPYPIQMGYEHSSPAMQSFQYDSNCWLRQIQQLLLICVQ